MNRPGIAALGLLLGLLTAPAPAQDPLAEDRERWAEVGEVTVFRVRPPMDWHLREEEYLGFELSFPCEPQREVISEPRHGLVRYSCAHAGHGYLALLGRHHEPEAFDPELFHAGTDLGLMQQLRAEGEALEVDALAHVNYYGLVGRQVEMRSQRLRIRKRTLTRGGLTVQLQVSSRWPNPGTPDSAEAFFNALRVVEPAAAQ